VYFEDNGNDDTDGAGLTLRTSSNPTNTGGAIFAVRSSGQAARLWVGQDITSVPNNKFGAGDYTGGTGNEGTISNYSFQIDGTNGNVDMTNGRMSVRYNTDTTHFFGRAAIGYGGYADYATFSHLDRASAGNYALLQYADGTTYLNCSNGKNIYLREDNVDILRIRRDNFIFIGTKATIEIYDVAPGAYSNELRIENTSGFGRITYTSSIREHKRDIEDADGDFIKNVVENLRPRFFRYIDDLVPQESKKQWSQIGLIADETNEVDPRLATFDANGETLTGVDYARVSVYLLAYIQQTLNPKIAELESKIDAILNRLDAEVQTS
jgi:hypothetical protein